MSDRSLEALGFTDVPLDQPLTYPGRPVSGPALLHGGELWVLTARRGPLGGWPVAGPYGHGAGGGYGHGGGGVEGHGGGRAEGPRGGGEPLDAVLTRLGAAVMAARHPVIAVGSNASPAQLRRKFTRRGVGMTLPMARVTVRGIGIGVSAHIGAAGYVAAAPYADPLARTEVVVSWFDDEQLRVVDATEHPNYRRLLLPGADFPMALPSAEPLTAAYVYAGVHGVLTGPDGTPRRGGGDQSELLVALLAASGRLRELLGPDPQTWVARARADAAVRAAGRAIFREEGWALPQEAFAALGRRLSGR
ncbi:hypothetical protein [Streptomyces sp. XD-27]|uniref:hypothetical protein n=1 Tax=Streptomyces sp. XD-27 TaxID=3062779 RepID=UPI0026F43284|nr:hypothetical protein [Streptomyces sp. XD-27]WKX72649.1 hypothetical protein Q3Y56_24545 [Streptomyces sp. XD-27]